MRVYGIVKAFVLPFMLGVYVLFLLTVATAHYSGGWVVVLVDRYHEGTAELALLTAILPPATYVTIKEVLAGLRNIKNTE